MTLGMSRERTKTTILVYTGDNDLAKSLTLLLQDQYVVQSTSRLVRALEAVESHDVDLLIADLGISLDRGLEFLTKVRQKNLKIPIIAFGPCQLRSSRVEGEILAKVDRLFHMPASVEEITQAISSLLGVRRRSTKLVHTHG